MSFQDCFVCFFSMGSEDCFVCFFSMGSEDFCCFFLWIVLHVFVSMSFDVFFVCFCLYEF